MFAYPPARAIAILCDHFLPGRGLRLVGAGLDPAEPPPPLAEDKIVSEMRGFHRLQLNALRASPRGRRDWAAVFVLEPESKYAQHLPNLRQLVETASAGRDAARLDEVFVVADEGFFARKGLLGYLAELNAPAAGLGQDPEGLAVFFTAVPFEHVVVPLFGHVQCQPHRLLSPEEADRLLKDIHQPRSELPTITVLDPPALWLGARAGDIIEIARGSELAVEAPYWRRAERAAW